MRVKDCQRKAKAKRITVTLASTRAQAPHTPPTTAACCSAALSVTLPLAHVRFIVAGAICPGENPRTGTLLSLIVATAYLATKAYIVAKRGAVTAPTLTPRPHPHPLPYPYPHPYSSPIPHPIPIPIPSQGSRIGLATNMATRPTERLGQPRALL